MALRSAFYATRCIQTSVTAQFTSALIYGIMSALSCFTPPVPPQGMEIE